MPPHADPTLLRRLHHGDVSAFEALYKSTYPSLILYATRLLGSRDTAADVVHDVFATLWNKRQTITITGSLTNYLYIACRNAAFDHLRSETARTRRGYRYTEEELQLIQSPLPDATTEQHSDYQVQAVWHAVDSLSPRARDVFLLTRRDGLTHAQVAERLGIARKTVEMHLARALDALRRAVAK